MSPNLDKKTAKNIPDDENNNYDLRKFAVNIF